MQISQTIGTDSSCTAEQLICNGPLEPGTQYQFKYRAYTTGDLFSESEYSGPISTGKAMTSHLPLSKHVFTIFRSQTNNIH